MWDWKMQDKKATVENAGLKMCDQQCSDGKWETEKAGPKLQGWLMTLHFPFLHFQLTHAYLLRTAMHNNQYRIVGNTTVTCF